ncbi:TIGR03668 family PPOX class F420-dependent oxidoreductase [Nonomuraea rhizosphaerae]|uniref:TIGR03668 family PPOX class F420-dependent oxidoreductase n=1 Tax=Nonomuraea rhizosphaerae TaxID=2665663 RepID=UPI0027E34D46|nr:TIGR03668 family PPOX class F420-dependent oxidoreductase [Nonomuraea rhizosphaerae]
MNAEEARARFHRERIARLATTDAQNTPHLVPVTFAALGDRVMIAIDHKPKTTTDLRRLRNIRENATVSLLVDHYEEDWAQLWWVRADGHARIVEAGPDHHHAVDALTEKYSQYRRRRPAGPVIVVTVTRWSGWAYTS